MHNVAAMELVELNQWEYVKVNGGVDPVTGAMVMYAGIVAAAAGAGFKWGWDNLGPIFNRWF